MTLVDSCVAKISEVPTIRSSGGMKMAQAQGDSRLTDGILNSHLFRSLAEGRTDVELWQDNHAEDGWELFRIVTFHRGSATILAELRSKDGQTQHRVHDEHGVESWREVT
jgi:hypothetical protein